MIELPDYLKQGDLARLIPVGSGNQKERAACSVLLSCLGIVQPYARKVLGEIGKRVGNAASIHTYTEAVFAEQPEGLNCRHDGLLVLDTGRRQWRAIIESKIGGCKIDTQQLAQYARLARANRVNAIITISNELTPRPDHLPYQAPREIRNLELYHWSWPYLTMQADLILASDLDFDYEQDFILREMVRYLDHESTDIRCFTQMGSGWPALVQRIHAAGRTTHEDPDVQEAVLCWHQAHASVCTRLARSLHLPVRARLSRSHRDDQSIRLMEDAKELANERTLRASFEVPQLADAIEVVVNAVARNIICRFYVDARQDRQRYQARLRWLLNQLPEESDSTALVSCIWDRGVRTQASLRQLREDANAARLEGAISGPGYFEIATVTDLANRFSGTRNFVPAVEEAVKHFYETIARHIRPWEGRASPESESALEGDDKIDSPGGSNGSADEARRTRNILRQGEFNGRSFSIFDDGSIEIETGNGVQRFKSFTELTAAAKNGHADVARNGGRGQAPGL